MKDRFEHSGDEPEWAAPESLAPAPGKRALTEPPRAVAAPSGRRPTGEVDAAKAVDALAVADGSASVDAAAIAPGDALRPAGKGAEALALLFDAGAPEPAQVVRILDGHRDQRAAILALVRARMGEAYLARVLDATHQLRADLDRRELVIGDPSDPRAGYALASEAAKGARWRTGDGRFDGTIDQRGLDARYHLDDQRAIHGTVDPMQRQAMLGYEAGGKPVAEAFARDRPGDRALGLRAHRELGDDRSVAAELRRIQRADGASTEVAGSYADPRTTMGVYVGRHESGKVVAGFSADHVLDPRTTMSASGTLGADSIGVAMSGSRRIGEELVLSGGLGHSALRDGRHGQTTVSVSERYRAANLVHSLDLSATSGPVDAVHGTGSVEGQLAPNLYAGAFGGFHAERGKEPEASLGASLTLTTGEKAALTLAGVLDRQGRMEARLQLDLFKHRIDTVRELSDNKKNALISLYVAYSTDRPGMLDDRFGAAEAKAHSSPGGGVITGGIRIRF